MMFNKCSGYNIQGFTFPSAKINNITDYIEKTDPPSNCYVVCVGSNDVSDSDFNDIKLNKGFMVIVHTFMLTFILLLYQKFKGGRYHGNNYAFTHKVR